MKKILSVDIVDIIPFQDGVLFVRDERIDDENVKVSFYSYSVSTDKIAPVAKSVYLMNKFGNAYASISDKLGDYVTCETGRLDDGSCTVVFPTGECGIFDADGVLAWNGDIFYHSAPGRSIAVENRHLWCVVPELDCVIRYSLAAGKVIMRIGGSESKTFDAPVSVTEYDDKLYISNSGSMKINTLDLRDFTVSDFLQIDEPVYKYIRSCDREFIRIESGVYMI